MKSSRHLPQPNFLIVGAAKCGTTSLANYLQQHPEVFLPAWKEPCYFALDEPGRPESFESYLALFREGRGATAIGEASTAYLYDPDAAERIRSALGEIKIIAMIRNPVDMVFSLWLHNCRTGVEPLSFVDAISRSTLLPPSLSASASAARYQYIERAMYTAQVARYLEKFDRRNVKIIFFEEFFSNPSRGFRSVCDFLALSRDYAPSSYVNYNRGAVARWPWLSHLIAKRNILRLIVRPLTSKNLRIKILSFLGELNRSKTKPSLDETLRLKLWQMYFREDALRLEALLNHPIDEWESRNTRS